MIDLLLQFVIPYIVQCFYGSRLWIMSNKNVLLTGSVLFLSTTQIVFGLGTTFGLNVPNTPLRTAFAGTGVLCDLIITGSVYFYLRPSRSGVKRFVLSRT
ncbi:hypothetical protein HYDPIDRAFT_25062 [Hydnomerulius pinastri MD-312]|nr:hypothetical protein HYDPIDRAFT_25062 [Hydnomerulius pinastri MD-312]